MIRFITFVATILFVAMSSAQEAGLIDLNYNSLNLRAGQRGVLLASVIANPSDANTDVFIESTFDNQPHRFMRFAETEFVAATDVLSAGTYNWQVKAYLQDKNFVENLEIAIFKMQYRISEIQSLKEAETDPVKIALLEQSILDLNSEISVFQQQILDHRVLVDTKSVVVNVASLRDVELLEDTPPSLQITLDQSTITYGDAVSYSVNVTDGRIGPQVYQLKATTNSNIQDVNKIGDRQFKVNIPIGNMIGGYNNTAFTLEYTNQFRLNSIDTAIKGIGAYYLEVLLLRDSAVDPALAAYYQKEINDLFVIEPYLYTYKQSLTKTLQTSYGGFTANLPSIKFHKVSAGDNFTCGIYRSAAFCWGVNSSKQLGLSNTTNLLKPTTMVNGLGTDVHQISAGGSHACAIQRRKIYCWGANNYGQLGSGFITTNSEPVSPSIFGLPTKVTTGLNHTCAIVSGKVYCWGYNQKGETGHDQGVGGAWPLEVAVDNAVDIAAGESHTCALTSLGQVYCWGANNVGQVGVADGVNVFRPTRLLGLIGIKKISVGSQNSCALTSYDSVVCWGSNASKQLGASFTGSSNYYPVDISGLEYGVTDIDVGSNTICAVQEGAAKCWGHGQNGSLGNGVNTNTAIPVTVTGMATGVTQISQGKLFGCAVQNPFYLKCWGQNYGGNIGNNTGVGTTLTPATVIEPTSLFIPEGN